MVAIDRPNPDAQLAVQKQLFERNKRRFEASVPVGILQRLPDILPGVICIYHNNPRITDITNGPVFVLRGPNTSGNFTEDPLPDDAEETYTRIEVSVAYPDRTGIDVKTFLRTDNTLMPEDGVLKPRNVWQEMDKLSLSDDRPSVIAILKERILKAGFVPEGKKEEFEAVFQQ